MLIKVKYLLTYLLIWLKLRHTKTQRRKRKMSMKDWCEHKRLENLDRAYRAGNKRPASLLTAAILLVRPQDIADLNIIRLAQWNNKRESIKRNDFSLVPQIFTAENSIIREVAQ